MDYRQTPAFADRSFMSRYPFSAFSNDSKSLPSAAIAVLTCLAFIFIVRHPTSIERKLWEIFVYFTPSPLLYLVDFASRGKQHKGAGEVGFARADFGDQRAKSDALVRILRLNHDSTTTVIQRARRLSGLDKVMRSANVVPAGLGNWDNSCYQNSVIQALASLSCFDDSLAEKPETTASQDIGPTHDALRGIINRLNKLENAGKRLWAPSALKSMNTWQQQDAQEYFSKIMDETENELSKLARSQNLEVGFGRETDDRRPLDSGKPNPFRGLLAQRVGCRSCRYTEGLSLVPFTCLTVNLGSDYEYSVQQCLDGYTAPEDIEGVECMKCTILGMKSSLEQMLVKTEVHKHKERAGREQAVPATTFRKTVTERLHAINEIYESGDYSDSRLYKNFSIPAKSRVSSTKSKQAVIARIPANLVIHVNRSIFDMTGFQRKNHAHVSFPSSLDLSRWCLGSKHVKAGQELFESWTTDPVSSMLPSSQAQLPRTNKAYKLRAVITHYGDHENGHYIAYRKRRKRCQQSDVSALDTDFWGDSWYRFSDDVVSSVSEEHVLAQGGVFMLFYEAIEGGTTDIHAPAAALSDESVMTSDEISPITTIHEEDDLSPEEPQTSETDIEPSAVAYPAAEAGTQPRLVDQRHNMVPLISPLPLEATQATPDPVVQSEATKSRSVAPAMRTAGALSSDSRNGPGNSNISMHSPSFVTAS